MGIKTGNVTGPIEKMAKWLRKQWRKSLAHSIWIDMTPLGRALLWAPLWLLCMLTAPLLVLSWALTVAYVRYLSPVVCLVSRLFWYPL